jgi:hypothetical protein
VLKPEDRVLRVTA